MKRIFLLFSLVLILSGCQNKVSPTNTLLPSPGNAQSLPQFMTDIETLAQTFSQTVEVADASSAEELPQVIRQLEAIQSDVQGLSAPPSALEAKAASSVQLYVLENSMLFQPFGSTSKPHKRLPEEKPV